MKKYILMACAALTIALAGCSPYSGKTTMKTELDSLSYAIGLSRTEGLGQFLRQNMIDTIYMDDFMKGFLNGVREHEPGDVAYNLGRQIGQLVSTRWVTDSNAEIFGEYDSTQTVSLDLMVRGFIDGATAAQGSMAVPQAKVYTTQHTTAIREALILEKYADVKKANEEWLEAKKQEEGVVVDSTGLCYKVITMGKGAVASRKDKVEVNYRGTLIDGTEFDSSHKGDSDKPATFRVSQVVKGWQTALQKMPVGSKWELYIPQELAYGSREQANIPPFSTLIFEVEVVNVIPNVPKHKSKK